MSFPGNFGHNKCTQNEFRGYGQVSGKIFRQCIGGRRGGYGARRVGALPRGRSRCATVRKRFCVARTRGLGPGGVERARRVEDNAILFLHLFELGEPCRIGEVGEAAYSRYPGGIPIPHTLFPGGDNPYRNRCMALFPLNTTKRRTFSLSPLGVAWPWFRWSRRVGGWIEAFVDFRHPRRCVA